MTRDRCLPVGLFALVTWWGCPTEPTIAHLRAVDGDVTVKTRTAPEPATVDMSLYAGNMVTTGADGRTTVEFEGGNRVDLLGNTTLVIRQSGGATAQFGAALIAGTARASSTGGGVMLAIGTPFGLTEVGATQSSIEMSVKSGLTVLMGKVTVLTEAGERKTLNVNDAIVLDGDQFVFKIGGPVQSDVDLVLNPMKFVLLSTDTKQVQVKRAGEKKWHGPRKREVLGPGDTVRTRKATGTKVQFGDAAGLTLKPKTELEFESAGTSEDAHRASYSLKAGNLLVRLKHDEKMSSKHKIAAGGLTMAVEPGLKEAAVEVSATQGGRAQVKVRFGRVLLPDGTAIDAGTTVTLKDGKTITNLLPLAQTQLQLKPRSSSIVYFSNEVPPIEFGWEPEQGAKSYVFEVALDRKFEKILFREKLTKNSFVYDRFPPGRFFWRVKGTGDWSRGALTIQQKKETQTRFPRHNTVNDTGEKTVVYYQKVLPAITLRWSAVKTAAQYQVKVYADGEFETPLLDKTSAETTATFKEGQFPEGKYYWQQKAMDAQGTEIHTGRMNTLQIAYDNAIIDLAIKSPRSWQKVSSKNVTTRGEVQLGAKLTINGKRASLDRKGRFNHQVKLNKGTNEIVYRTVAADGVERYYVRHVLRR